MPMKTRITDVRHNAETGCFEADVTLMDGLDSFTYSVDHPAPIQTEVDVIKAELAARARAQHFPSGCTLTRRRMDRAMPNRTSDVATDILLSQPNYLEQILGRRVV